MLKIKRAETQAEFFGLARVRTLVFVKEQQVDPEIELDCEDDTAIHYIAIMDGQVVGTCRILLHEKEAKLGRMAILAPYRRMKIASALIHAVEQERSALAFTNLKLGAQMQAIPFYESCGFQVYGPVFLDANIEHRMMVKNYE